MERQVIEPKCFFGFFYIMISCKWISALDLVTSIVLTLIFLNLAFTNLYWILASVCFLMFIALVLLFIYGLLKEDDKLMIPLIVAKVLLSLAVSTGLVITYIIFLLSLFSFITVESPIDGISVRRFFAILIMVLSVSLILCLRILQLYSRAYEYVKRKNEMKHVDCSVELCGKPEHDQV